MKIVFVCNEYPPLPHGGIGTFVQTIARGLSRKGHLVTVVGLGELTGVDTDEGVRVVSLRASKLRYLGNFTSRLRLRRWLLSRIRARAVDVIEAPDYQGLLPFGLDGVSVVIRLHLSYTAMSRFAGRKKGRGISIYERRTLQANSNWVGVSQFILDLTQSTFGATPKRSAVVYNPVPPAPQNVLEASELPANFVLYASQVSRRKGALVLAEAGRELLAHRPDLHLVYAGGAVPEDGGQLSLESIQEILGPQLAERVHFLGHISREKVLACMRRARVLAFPSILEALPITVLEAMSSGLPIVCTNYPPGPEIVEDGVTGLLADPKSPKDFGEKITRLLDDPALAKSIAANAQRFVAEHFSLEKCIDETERFYEKCLSR